MKTKTKRFLGQQALYSMRWQISTLPLAWIAKLLHHYFGINDYGILIATGNFIWSFGFFWLDKCIFNGQLTEWIMRFLKWCKNLILTLKRNIIYGY